MKHFAKIINNILLDKQMKGEAGVVTLEFNKLRLVNSKKEKKEEKLKEELI